MKKTAAIFTDSERDYLVKFIDQCRTEGKDPVHEAQQRLNDVVSRLERSTNPYRIAYAMPLAFYLLHSTQESIKILERMK